MLLEELEKIIRQQNMLEDNDAVVLGLSGGVDSVCLFHLMRELAKKRGYRLVAVHLNHGIRPEADADEAFVARLCKTYEIELVSKRMDIVGLAAASGRGVEEQARDERYRLFEEVRNSYGAKAIALAHHQEDQAETVLHHLIRGSALRGLGGMRHKRDHIIRPLLSVSKKALEAYCRDNGYKWVEDLSNRDLKYTRNRLRHQILPLLRAINPSVDKQLIQTSLLLQEDEDALEKLSKEWMQEKVRFYGCLAAEMDFFDWESAPKAFRTRFYSKTYLNLTGRGLEKKYILMLEEQLQESREVDLPGGIFLRLSKERLVMGSKRMEKIAYREELELPGEVELAIGLTVRANRVNQEQYECLVECERGTKICFHADADKLGGKVVLRNREPKDAYAMLGAAGKASVKKLFSSLGLGAYASQNMPVLCTEAGRIVWAAGGRIHPEYRVTEETRRIVLVELLLH